MDEKLIEEKGCWERVNSFEAYLSENVKKFENIYKQRQEKEERTKVLERRRIGA